MGWDCVVAYPIFASAPSHLVVDASIALECIGGGQRGLEKHAGCRPPIRG